MMKRATATIPMLGILLFVVAYFYTATLYSAATTLDPATHGYQHLHNYVCDLYDSVTYTGQPNAGRPYAMAATLFLTTSLIFFFLSVPALFREFPRLGLFVRCTGAVSMMVASVVFTPLHDLVITVGVPLGALAIAGTCVGLFRTREWGLLVLAIVAVTVCVWDYVIWKLVLLKPQQPMIQKTAFGLFFLWVVVMAIRILRQGRAPRRGGVA